MLKCFCDKCGKELTTGYMEIGASYSHDPSPEAPGHVMENQAEDPTPLGGGMNAVSSSVKLENYI